MNMGEPLEEIFINKQTKDEKMKIRHTIYLTRNEIISIAIDKGFYKEKA